MSGNNNSNSNKVTRRDFVAGLAGGMVAILGTQGVSWAYNEFTKPGIFPHFDVHIVNNSPKDREYFKNNKAKNSLIESYGHFMEISLGSDISGVEFEVFHDNKFLSKNVTFGDDVLTQRPIGDSSFKFIARKEQKYNKEIRTYNFLDNKTLFTKIIQYAGDLHQRGLEDEDSGYRSGIIHSGGFKREREFLPFLFVLFEDPIFYKVRGLETLVDGNKALVEDIWKRKVINKEFYDA